jgi:hypothetical protein
LTALKEACNRALAARQTAYNPRLSGKGRPLGGA